MLGSVLSARGAQTFSETPSYFCARADRSGSVPRIEVERGSARDMKVLLSRTDNTDMYRRAFARHRTGAALLLGLSLRAPSASAERAEPDETRVGTVESGHVRSSSVETPQGHGFDEEATRAARELLFEPALRAGVPVPARIRYRYIFEVPDATRVGQVTDAVTGLPVAGASLLEVTVRGQPSVHRGDAGQGVPYLSHIGLDPSVIHPGLSDRVDLYLGGDPARFGRFAGLEPAPSGEANLRLFDLGGLIEPTFARGRGSLLPALLSLLIPEVKLDNRDYQARATYEPSARDRFSAFGFGPYDLLGEKRNGSLTRLGDAFRPKITVTW
jgi:TonB family protein